MAHQRRASTLMRGLILPSPAISADNCPDMRERRSPASVPRSYASYYRTRGADP